jgi:CMP-N,N'-diacetyllegionaminic acid synthase
VRILAVVTARGGSKRLPGKNLRQLGGLPLVAWSVGVVHGIPEITACLVSTDDPGIAEAARSAGAIVPWLRPAELATDNASSVDVAIHALDWYEGDSGTVDGLLLLQPTSPFRRRESIERGLELYRGSGHRPIVGVSPAAAHPFWCYFIEDESMRPVVDHAVNHVRSQELPPAFVLNGAFYLISPKRLRAERSFYTRDMVPLVMEDRIEGLDIDTELDWTVAEAAARQRPAPGLAK